MELTGGVTALHKWLTSFAEQQSWAVPPPLLCSNPSGRRQSQMSQDGDPESLCLVAGWGP